MSAAKRSRRRKNTWANEIDDLIRGMAGGFLFGIPLLYTMEVWWIGSFSTPPRMLSAMLGTFLVVFLLNRTAGFRKSQGVGPLEAFMDTVQAIAIGLICTILILFLLREVSLNSPLEEALGKIIFEAIPFTLGVALANQFLSGDRLGKDGDEESGPKDFVSEQDNLNETLSDIGATLIGATIIAFNIAPTDEVTMLASAVSGPWLLALMAASLLISYGIVFEAGFANQQKRQQQPGIFQRPLSETIASYLVSLMASALMLFFFQQLGFDDPWTMWLNYTLILGLPATIGGAAGRLAV